MYLYRAIDSVGDTVEFFFSKSRDLPAAKRFFKRPWSGMTGPIVLSSMAARQIAKRSVHVMRLTD
jgi:transposase-like protein